MRYSISTYVLRTPRFCYYFNLKLGKSKGKVHPRTDHEGSERE